MKLRNNKPEIILPKILPKIPTKNRHSSGNKLGFAESSRDNTDPCRCRLREHSKINQKPIEPKEKSFYRTSAIMNKGEKTLRSFRGCKSCKASKRRCSEEKPQCALCARQGRKCEVQSFEGKTET